MIKEFIVWNSPNTGSTKVGLGMLGLCGSRHFYISHSLIGFSLKLTFPVALDLMVSCNMGHLFHSEQQFTSKQDFLPVSSSLKDNLRLEPSWAEVRIKLGDWIKLLDILLKVFTKPDGRIRDNMIRELKNLCPHD